MCILFIHTGGSTVGGYRLILASNRDEYFVRPAQKAARWNEDNSVIGGRDMEPGREGGTWLAGSADRARVAALLNLSGELTPPNTRGRGSIVTNFVLGDKSTEEYLEEFHKNGHEYSAFNLVTVHIKEKSSMVHHYSNLSDRTETYNDVGVVGFSNSSPDRPLKKVVAGKKKFEKIVTRCTAPDGSKDMLINELLSLLKCKEQHLPDDELERRIPNAPGGLSSVFVDVPQLSYGTRTHTIILVDADGKFDFYEWTMEPGQEEWVKTHIQAN